ncbi:hypothetical protein BDZ91DRAFT_717863, partial [Kalaharituber pfeilii]
KYFPTQDTQTHELSDEAHPSTGPSSSCTFLFFTAYDLGAGKRFRLLKPTRCSRSSCCRRQKRWKQLAPSRDIGLQGVCRL